MSGITSYLSGLAAEEIVAHDYRRAGYAIEERRWRSRAGEIDLIARKDGQVVFVEVKKSRSFSDAAYMLGARQIRRLFQAASMFLAKEPGGLDSEARFDVALVNRHGAVSVLENALCA